MSVLINAYCTQRDVPKLNFAHQLCGRRDRSDPELADHLNGFLGYVLKQGGGEMTRTLYYVMRHIQRVRQHLSLEVEEDALGAFEAWSLAANAICFLPDGTIRDPQGRRLVDPETGEPDPEAQVPFPEDARKRCERQTQWLRSNKVHIPDTLPPVIGDGEVVFRPAAEVAQRMLALFLVAVRAESLATEDEIPVAELRSKSPFGFAALSPAERQFLNARLPTQQEIVDFAWRYEALFVLEWALGLVKALPFPSKICDVPLVARLAMESNATEYIQSAALRPAAQILDVLDVHFRVHWAVTEARLNNVPAPAKLDGGVVMERHHALNWLIQFEDKEWDDVDTPT
jgi:hypothetical protein